VGAGAQRRMRVGRASAGRHCSTPRDPRRSARQESRTSPERGRFNPRSADRATAGTVPDGSGETLEWCRTDRAKRWNGAVRIGGAVRGLWRVEPGGVRGEQGRGAERWRMAWRPSEDSGGAELGERRDVSIRAARIGAVRGLWRAAPRGVPGTVADGLAGRADSGGAELGAHRAHRLRSA